MIRDAQPYVLPAVLFPVDPLADRDLGGLVAQVGDVERPFPLQLVRVRATIGGGVARTEVEQRFANPYNAVLDVVHLFPLPPDAAVVEAELIATDCRVRAECRRRAEAEAAFDEAREAGHQALLLTAERADIHQLRLTNLPPGAEVTVRLVLVELLAASGGRFLWRFPTTIAPRYLPGDPVGHQGAGILPDTDRVPDASRLQPPLRLAGGTVLDLEVRIDEPVRRVESAQHAVALDLADGGVVVAPAGTATLDRDFVLAMTAAAADQPTARALTDGRQTLVVVEPPNGVVRRSIPRDAVFVIDISGSMEGAKLAAAKRAVVAAIHGLLPGDRFRLIAFDDQLELFAGGAPVELTDASLGAADAWVKALTARGGTEMAPALRQALNEVGNAAGPARLGTVLFVTDGQAWNEAELVALVANRRGRTRLFTLGIDTAVNASLMQRLARVGGGACELAGPDDHIETVIARVEAAFGWPLLTDVAVEGAGLEAARPGPADVFAGRPRRLLLAGASDELTVTAIGPEGPERFVVRPTGVSLPLGVLWARERVAWLEDRLVMEPSREEALAGEIAREALAWGIASRETAFVAVRSETTTDGQRVEVVQPAELPHRWEAPPGAAMAMPLHMAALPSPAMVPPRAAGALPGVASPKRSLGRVFRGSRGQSAAAPPPPAPPPATPFVADAIPRSPNDRAATSSGPVAGPYGDAEAVASPVRAAEELAGLQRADGRFGESVGETVAALLVLVLAHNNRRQGLQWRTVAKACVWLEQHGATDADAAWALSLVEAAEEGGATAAPDKAWSTFTAFGRPGELLGHLLAGVGRA